MVEPLRHRQTKGAETDMPGLPPPRHIPTLPSAVAVATVPSDKPYYHVENRAPSGIAEPGATPGVFMVKRAVSAPPAEVWPLNRATLLLSTPKAPCPPTWRFLFFPLDGAPPRGAEAALAARQYSCRQD